MSPLIANHAWITDTPGGVAAGWTLGLQRPPVTSKHSKPPTAAGPGRRARRRGAALPGCYGGVAPATAGSTGSERCRWRSLSSTAARHGGDLRTSGSNPSGTELTARSTHCRLGVHASVGC